MNPRNDASRRFFNLLLALLFLNTSLKAQLETSKWLFSGNYGTGIPLLYNFNSLPPVLDTMVRKMNFQEANSSICNKSGNILFYTNGIWIANSLNDTMLNGNRINPGNFSASWVSYGMPEIQGTLILPLPGDSNKYFIFHNCPSLISPNPTKPIKMYYTVVDMSLDGGLGAVLSKNNVILIDTIHPGEITACKHANGRDWWMPIHKFRSNKFYWFLITPQGVVLDHVQNIGTFRNKSGGQVCFSPNGKWFAQYSGDTEMNLYKFDRCTGILSNFLHTQFQDSSIIGGVAFSPSSKILYASTPKSVYQFDLTDSNVIGSQNLVASWDTTYSPHPPFAASFGLMQVMRDNKIYLLTPNSTLTFHRINFPDSLGTACNVEQHFNTLPNYSDYTIPNFPNYFLGADSGRVCDTLMLSIRNTKFSFYNTSISVFPNPAQDYLQVNYTPTEYVKSLQILDVYGKIILEKKLSPFSQLAQFGVSKFSSGIYMCKLMYQGKVISCKFVKE